MTGWQPNGGGQAFPDPATAADLTTYVGLLDQLRIRCGEPSYRVLARQVGPLMRPPRQLAHSTVAAAFQPGRRRLDQDLLVAIVRALTGDEAAVDAWRRAYLRIQRDAKSGGAPGVFRQLPADLPTFTGREDALKLLLDVAASAPAPGRAATVVVSAIEGMGGIGKTQLAVHAAHALVRAGRYTDIQLFADLRGFDPEQPPADPAVVLEAFLRALQVSAVQIPERRDERAAMFRDRLHDKHALIVLDNAAGAEQVRDLIPAGPDCLVLVTSRRSLADLDGASQHVLDVFTAAEAVELLGRIAGPERVAAEPDAAEQLVRACGLLPLAVALAGARLKSRPAWKPSDLLARLRSTVLGAVGPGGRSLRPVFELSFRTLDPVAQRVFCLLALHPGSTVDAFAAAALADIRLADAEAALDTLLDHHLLEQHSAEQARFHDLLRTLAAEQLAAMLDDHQRQSALARLFDHYRYAALKAVDLIEPGTRHRRPRIAAPASAVPAFADAAEARSWLDRERANLLAVATASVRTHGADFSSILWRPLYDQARFREGLALHTLAADACRAGGDVVGLGNVLRFAAANCIRLGRYDQADAALREAIEITTEPADLAAALAASGNLDCQLGRYEQAATLHERALALHRGLGDRVAEAIDLNNLGLIRWELGHYALAASDLAQALAVLGDARPQGRIEMLVSLAAVHERLGEYPQAVTLLEEALARSRDQGVAAVEARALRHLGLTRLGQGDHTGALDILRQALDLHRTNGDRTGEGECHCGLGLAHLASGQPDQAVQCFEQALHIAGQLGEPPQRARALGGLGDALRALDRLEAAHRAQRDALDVALTLSDPYLLAQAHAGLGRVEERLGEEDSAREHLNAAREGFIKLGIPRDRVLRIFELRDVPGEPGA